MTDIQEAIANLAEASLAHSQAVKGIFEAVKAMEKKLSDLERRHDALLERLYPTES